MMKLYKNNLRLARKIAIGTFIAGLIFLVSYYLTFNYSLVIGGSFFGLGIFLIVLTIYASDLITAKRQNFSKKQKLNTFLWNFATILILIIYTIIGLNLANKTKLKITNNSTDTIENVYLYGCENKKINDIKAMTSKTYLLATNNDSIDCIVGIRYTTTNTIEDEVVINDVKKYYGKNYNFTIN